MSDKETICTKVEPPLKERVDQYAEDHEMKRSPAMRDLIKDGLDDDNQPTITPTAYIAGLGIAAAAAGLLDASQTVGVGGIVIFAAAVIYQVID